MKRTLFIVTVLLTSFGQIRAQAPQFSQFFTNPIFQNPALAGDAGAPRLIMNYRNQWPSVGTPFQTSAVSFDTYAEDTQVGLGVQALYDRRGGAMGSTHLAGQVSRLFYLDANRYLRFTPGVQAAWVSNRWNSDNLTFVSQFIDPGGLPDPLAKPGFTDNYAVFSSGIRFDYDPQTNHEAFYWAGVSFHNMGYRDNDWLRERWGLQMGAQFPLDVSIFGNGYGSDLDRNSALSIAMQLRRQGMNKQMDLGANVIFSPLIVGAWYRGLFTGPKRRDAIVATIGWARDNILFQAGYDLTISSLGTETGAFELSIWYGFDALFRFAGKNSSARRQTRCLRY